MSGAPGDRAEPRKEAIEPCRAMAPMAASRAWQSQGLASCEPGLTRAISAYASPRIPSQLEPLMKNLSDSVMAAMLALTVTLGP